MLLYMLVGHVRLHKRAFLHSFAFRLWRFCRQTGKSRHGGLVFVLPQSFSWCLFLSSAATCWDFMELLKYYFQAV